MSANKRTIERYMEGFHRSDHGQVLDCLTDDVEWVLPGVFHLVGKEEFDREIENAAFEGSPDIHVTLMVEEGNIVVAEGTVKAKRKGGELLNLAFVDVFEMDGGLIRRLRSYLAEVEG